MPTALESITSKYSREITDNEQRAQTIVAIAAEEERDLEPHEVETLDKIYERNQKLNDQMGKTARTYGVDQDVADRIKLIGGRTGQQDVQYRSAGYLLHDMLHANSNTDARERYDRFARAAGIHNRAAEHLGYDAANTVATAGGYQGLAMIPGVGPVLDPYPQGRPIFSAIGARLVPGMEFKRPRIVDPDFLTGVGPRTQEKAEAVSKTWNIESENVTLDLHSGYINVSELLLEMIPGSLDGVIDHMNRRLTAVTEAAVVTHLAASTATAAIPATPDSSDVFSALGTAASAVFTATGYWPNWVAMGGQGAAKLMATTDLAGRQIWPYLGPSNAAGTSGFDGSLSSVAGLRPIISPAITDDALYIGGSMFGLELYERRFGVMQALEPSLFGRQISVNAAVGVYDPITTEADPSGTPAAKRESVYKITWA